MIFEFFFFGGKSTQKSGRAFYYNGIVGDNYVYCILPINTETVFLLHFNFILEKMSIFATKKLSRKFRGKDQFWGALVEGINIQNTPTIPKNHANFLDYIPKNYGDFLDFRKVCLFLQRKNSKTWH